MEPLSKAKLKLFAGLHYKRQRRKHQCFLAEGHKLVEEAFKSGASLEAVVVQPQTQSRVRLPANVPLFQANAQTFRQLSSQSSPEGIVAVVHFPARRNPPPEGPALLLYDINDPGNLGSLLRTAAWFGIPAVYCSPNSADCYNPKVVRSSMGGIFRVAVQYIEEFENFIFESRHKILAAAPGGRAPEQSPFQDRPYLLLGSESHGLPDGWLNDFPLQIVTIPGHQWVESLNVSVAGGILTYWLYANHSVH